MEGLRLCQDCRYAKTGKPRDGYRRELAGVLQVLAAVAVLEWQPEEFDGPYGHFDVFMHRHGSTLAEFVAPYATKVRRRVLADVVDWLRYAGLSPAAIAQALSIASNGAAAYAETGHTCFKCATPRGRARRNHAIHICESCYTPAGYTGSFSKATLSRLLADGDSRLKYVSGTKGCYRTRCGATTREHHWWLEETSAAFICGACRERGSRVIRYFRQK